MQYVLRIFVIAFTLLPASGCFSYQVLSEKSGNASAIAQASTFHARPLTMSFDHTTLRGSEEKWDEHLADWRAAYAEDVVAAPGGKTVKLVGADASPGDGVVIAADLPRLEKALSGITGEGNFATMQLTFTDAASGEVLHEARLRAVGAGSFGAFAPQIRNAIGTCVEGVHEIIASGSAK